MISDDIEIVFSSIKTKDPFVSGDLKIRGMGKQDVSRALSALAKEGRIRRLGYGVFVKGGDMSSDLVLAKALENRYIGNESEPIGFYARNSFIPYVIGSSMEGEGAVTIITNKATSCVKKTFVFGRSVTLIRPYLKVTKKNLAANALLSYLAYVSPSELESNIPVLSSFIKREQVSTDEITKYGNLFPRKSVHRLFVSGLYRSLWKR